MPRPPRPGAGRRGHRDGPGPRVPLLVGPGRADPAAGRRAPRAATSGTSTGTGTWTSPASWSTPTSATSTRRSIAAIAAQAAKLTTLAPQHASEVRGEAAARLAGLAPAGLEKIFFTNGGADANENAIRMARLHTGRPKVLSFYRSYHGNTGAAISSTGDPRRWPNEFATGHVHFFGPYLYRSAFWADSPEQECERALAHLEQVIQFEGAGDHRGDPAGDHRRHGRGADPAARLPGRGPRALRPARDRLYRRRGHVRLRPDRPVVRVRGPRRGARPDHLRQGRQLRLRPGRRRRSSPTRSRPPSPTGCSPAA